MNASGIEDVIRRVAGPADGTGVHSTGEAQVAAIRLLTKTQLKAERLKPASNQRPTARYWQGQGWVYQYDASMAVAMKPYRASSAAQSVALAAGRKLAGTEPCTGCGQRIDRRDLDRKGCCDDCADRLARDEWELARVQWDRDWRATCHHAACILALDPLFLDTETTGLGEDAEIIEIAVLDRHGVILLETLVKPVGTVPAEASAIHCLSNHDLVDAPAWPVVVERLADVLRGHVVVAHNAGFDARMIEQASRRHGLAVPKGERWECTLDLLTAANDGRSPRLGTAMSLARAKLPEDHTGRPHRAAYDAACCRQILLALAGKHAQFLMSQPAAEDCSPGTCITAMTC